jgi:hypothetical protein
MEVNMPARKKAQATPDRTQELIRDLIIVQLGLAGVGQREIRAIVGGDANRISRIVKNLKTPSQKASTLPR